MSPGGMRTRGPGLALALARDGDSMAARAWTWAWTWAEVEVEAEAEAISMRRAVTTGAYWQVTLLGLGSGAIDELGSTAAALCSDWIVACNYLNSVVTTHASSIVGP